MGGKCYFCDVKDPALIEFAHVKETKVTGVGRGQYNRLKDVFDNRDSYRLMSEDCHNIFDGLPQRKKKIALQYGIIERKFLDQF